MEGKETITLGSDISWANIDVAENGYIVNWSEKSKEPSKGYYDDCSHTSRNMIFGEEEGDEAFDLLKKLKMSELERKRKK